MWSYEGNYPTESLPDEINLENGDRVESASATPEQIASAGYAEVSDPPTITHLQLLRWDLSGWRVLDNTEEATRLQWEKVRAERDKRIKAVEWRVFRYLAFERLNKDQLDEIEYLDQYIQDLRDITNQSDPWDIEYPSGFEIE
tara:strand:- start:4509 stop:4937 length:429 start_codon:yes stop_codon:yes gene_type:complete